MLAQFLACLCVGYYWNGRRDDSEVQTEAVNQHSGIVKDNFISDQHNDISFINDHDEGRRQTINTHCA